MVTARIDLQGLHEELKGFKDGFEAWAQQSVASAEAQKEKHLRHLRELQTTIRNLQQQQNDLENKALEVQHRLHDEKEQIADLEAELAKIQAEQEALPALVAEVQAALAAEASAAEADAVELETRETAQQKTVKGVNTALDMYIQRLGLSFVHNTTTQQLEIVFTQIDVKQPQREFTVAVKLLEDDRYEVRSCSPQLAEIQDLVDELNASNNFSDFARSVRKAFIATV